MPPDRPTDSRIRSVLIGVAALLIVLTCQALTVRYNREGKWTALYCTGTERPLPPVVEGEHVFRFPGPGFDGQFYHLIAHDPWMSHGTAQYVDDARLRYRRILIPAMANVLAAGEDARVDPAYILTVLLWTALGSYWCSRLVISRGHSAAWGLAFLAIPAVVASADRLTADVALLALCAGFALHGAEEWPLVAICALAPLVRETGVLLPAAAVVHALLRKDVRRAAMFAATTLPFLCWAVFVGRHTEATAYPLDPIPLSGIVAALGHARAYVDKPHLIALLDQITDAVALVGMLIALGLATRWVRRDVSLVGVAGLLFAAMGFLLQRPDHWLHVFDFGRVYSPLLFFLMVDPAQRPRFVGAAPSLLMYPRIALQLGSQLTGVAIGLLGSLHGR